MGWLPLLGGSGANAIPLSGLTVKSNAYVGRPMPRLDEIRKLASAMAAADKSVRYLTAAWAALLKADSTSTACQHPRVHTFPALPLLTDGGVVLVNFPQLELFVVCGLPLAAYPGEPHVFADVGYSLLKKK